jgi:hypothetical protein
VSIDNFFYRERLRSSSSTLKVAVGGHYATDRPTDPSRTQNPAAKLIITTTRVIQTYRYYIAQLLYVFRQSTPFVGSIQWPMGAGGGKIERAKKVKGLNIIHKFYK